MITVSGTRFLNNGKPWRRIGDTAWWLPNRLGGGSACDLYLSTRAKQGFNCIQLGVDAPEAFTGYDVRKPNLAWWRKVDRMMARIRAFGLCAEVGVGFRQCYDPVRDLPYKQGEALGKFVASRSRAWPLSSWIVAGLDERTIPVDAILAIAAGIRSVDRYRLISYHALTGTNTSEHIPLGSKHNWVYCQSGHTWMSRDYIRTLRGRAPDGVVWVNGEPCYDEYHGIGAAQIREVALGSKDVSASGYSYGHIDVYCFKRGVWHKKLATAGVKAFLAIALG